MSNGNQVTIGNYVAVQNALSEYCQALDAQDEATLTSLFVSDATIKVPLVGRVFTGSAGVKEFVEMVKGKVKPGTLHHESNVFIGNSNQWFTNVSYWQCVYQGRIVSYGKHDDLLLVDKDGKAKFVTRTITHVWTSNDQPAKQKPSTPSAATSTTTTTTADGVDADGADKKRRGRRGRRGGGRGRSKDGDSADTQPTTNAAAAAASSSAASNNNRAKNNGVVIDRDVSVFVAGYDKSDPAATLAALQVLFAKFGPHEIISRHGHSFVVFTNAAAANAAIAAFTATPPTIGANKLVIERPRDRSKSQPQQTQQKAPQQS
jgi:hypothetical protein